MSQQQCKDFLDVQIIQLEEELSTLSLMANGKRGQLDHLKFLHFKLTVEEFPNLNAA